MSLRQEDETTARVWVNHRDCANIIGRGGHTMKEIERKSGTRMKAMNTTDPSMLRLRGAPKPNIQNI